jgi:hypothetical protein
MDTETSPACVCGGSGTLPADPNDPDDSARIPCGACLRRHEETRCRRCEAHLGAAYLEHRHAMPQPWHSPFRVCSTACATAIERTRWATHQRAHDAYAAAWVAVGAVARPRLFVVALELYLDADNTWVARSEDPPQLVWGATPAAAARAWADAWERLTPGERGDGGPTDTRASRKGDDDAE